MEEKSARKFCWFQKKLYICTRNSEECIYGAPEKGAEFTEENIDLERWRNW